MHAPLRPAFRVEWRDVPALGALADEWRGLAARAIEPNIFYEPAFMLAAAPVLGQGAGALLVRSPAGRLAGLFPARIERPAGGLSRMLVGWTHPYAPLGTPLVDRSDADTVIAAWLAHLAGDASVPSLLLMPLIPEQGPFAAALDAALVHGGYRHTALARHPRALLAPGADRTNYLERAVSTGRRKELRRQRRRLEEVAAVTFTTATRPEDVRAALQDFLALEASGWKGVAGTAIANTPAIRRFVEAAVGELAAAEQARIERLLLDGEPVAAAITLTSGETAWCWKIAYSEALARSSPGVQLVIELTRSLLDQPGPARVDSCATADHPMIDHLWRERLVLSDRLIALRAQALPFAITCRVETMRRAAIGIAKSARDRIRGR